MQKMTPELLETIGQPAFLLEPDQDGLPIYTGVNEAWLNGVKRPRHLTLGETAMTVFPGRFGKVAFEHHISCLQHGVPQSYILTLPLGSALRSAQTHLRTIRNAQGRVVQIVGVSQDVTVQTLADEAQANSDTLTHELEDFVALAAHDLRAPMRHVTLLADMLRENFEDLGDGKLDLIASLEQVAGKATELITDLLSHAQTTTTVRVPEAFSLNTICRDVFVMLDPFDHHDFRSDETWILADRATLLIALRNLIDNAFKHCGRDHVQMRIHAEVKDDMIEIIVQDNGKGFKDPAMAFLGGGGLRTDSGYGLLGVRRMIEARGGSISASHALDGVGSMIRFTLPGSVVPTLQNPKVPESVLIGMRH